VFLKRNASANRRAAAPAQVVDAVLYRSIVSGRRLRSNKPIGGYQFPTSHGHTSRIRLISGWRAKLTRLGSHGGGLFPDGCRYRGRPLDGFAGRIPASIFFGIGFLVIYSFSVARFLKQPCTGQ
jgi:hypothetical protein